MASEFKDIYQNNPSYTDPTYTSQWFECSSLNSVVYTVYSSNNCDMYIEYAVDTNYNVIITETKQVIAGSSTTIQSTVKASYIRFRISNIVNPSQLITQGFYLS